jgi:5-methylcytosine-specific restriction protein A
MPVSPPVHRPVAALSELARKRAYDAARPSRAAIYGRRWRALRAAYLATHPICECGCGRAASVVDHRTPHNGDERLLYSWNNLQAMTKACHDAKTAKHDGGFGNPIAAKTRTPSLDPSASVRGPYTVCKT